MALGIATALLLSGLALKSGIDAANAATAAKNKTNYWDPKKNPSLDRRVTEYITQGGHPEYQNATTHPKTLSVYNQPYAKKNGAEYGTFEYYKAPDGTYTRDLSRVSNISFNDKSGKITVTLPDKWVNDEVIKKISDSYVLEGLSNNYIRDKNVMYQDPYDETQKVNTQKYIEMLNTALKDRTTALEATAPTKVELLNRFGGSEKRDKVINSITADDIIIMSADGNGKNDPALSVPNWLLMAYPEIAKLSSYTNGYVKADDFRKGFYNIEDGKITESQANAIVNTTKKMLSEDVDDMTPEEYARTAALYNYLAKHDPQRSGWDQFWSGGEAMSRSFFSSYYNNMYNWVADTADILTNIANFSWVHGNSINVAETIKNENDFGRSLEEWNQQAYEANAKINFNAKSAADAATLQAGLLAEATQTVAIMATTQAAAQGLTSAIISSKTAKLANDMVASGKASTATGLATAGQSAAAYQAAQATAQKALAAASKTSATQRFFNMTVSQLKNAFYQTVGGTEAVLNSMSITQQANIVNSAVKIANSARYANTAVNMLSLITLSAVQNNRELTMKVLSSEATSDEAALWLRQTAFDTGKLMAFSALTSVGDQFFGQALKGTKLEAKVAEFKRNASQKVTNFSSKLSGPWLKFRDWWISKKTAPGKTVSNATVSSSEAIKEAKLLNEARANVAAQSTVAPNQMSDTAANMGVPPVIADAQVVNSTANLFDSPSSQIVKMGVVVNGATGTITPYDASQADLAELENQLTDWSDVDTNVSIVMHSITNPDIEPVMSQQVSEAMKADSELLRLEEKAGLLDKEVIKLNKKLGKGEYKFIYSSHSQASAIYAARSYDLQILKNEAISENVNPDEYQPYLDAKERLDNAAKNLPENIRNVIDKKVLPTLRNLEHSFSSRMTYDWHVFPEDVLNGLRNDRKWGINGKDWLRTVARKDLPKGAYMPYSKIVQRDNTLELNRFKILEDDDITWIGNGLSELIREAAIANAERGFLKTSIKATGLTPEVVVSGEKTAAARSLKEYRTELNNEINNSIRSFSNDIKLTTGVAKKADLEVNRVQKEVNITGGIETMPIDELRVVMKDKGLLTTDYITDEMTLGEFYEKSSPQAKKIISDIGGGKPQISDSQIAEATFKDEIEGKISNNLMLETEIYRAQTKRGNKPNANFHTYAIGTDAKAAAKTYGKPKKYVLSERAIIDAEKLDGASIISDIASKVDDADIAKFAEDFIEFPIGEDRAVIHPEAFKGKSREFYNKLFTELGKYGIDGFSVNSNGLREAFVSVKKAKPLSGTLLDDISKSEDAWYNNFFKAQKEGSAEYEELMKSVDRANALASDAVKKSSQVKTSAEQYSEFMREIQRDANGPQEYSATIEEAVNKNRELSLKEFAEQNNLELPDDKRSLKSKVKHALWQKIVDGKDIPTIKGIKKADLDRIKKSATNGDDAAKKSREEFYEMLENTDLFKQASAPNPLKYDIDEEKIISDMTKAINKMVDLVRTNKKAALAVDGIAKLQGVNLSDTRFEFIVLDNILNKEGGELFNKTLSNVAKTIVNDNIPKKAIVIKGNLDSLYDNVEKAIKNQLISRLASDKAALESNGEKVDSATVTELLDEYNKEIVGANVDPVVVKTTNSKGEIEFLRVSPTIASIYNNRPIYTPMSTPMQLLANMALLKRISLTNLNPRSFSKQAASDTALAFASAGALPGTFNMLGDEIAIRFGNSIAEFFKQNDPTRFENIRIIANRDKISLAEAAVKNSEAIGNVQLPFNTMNQEALRQADAAKYGTKQAVEMRRKSINQKMNSALRRASDKLGKPNDKREEYTRKIAGQKAYRNALEKGFNPTQAESFRRQAIDNATTNFRQKHTVFNNLRITTPYLTSGISGAKSFWKMFELDPVGVSSRIFTGFILPIIYFMGEIVSDEDLRKQYEELAEYEKANHIIIAINGQLVGIPVGEELGAITNVVSHIVESMYGENQYDFWNLMLNDLVGFVPGADLTGFTDPEMWEPISDEAPSFLEVMDNGIASILSSTMPPIAQSLYMATSGKDLYTGKRVDTSKVSIDADGNAVIQSYSQSQFAKAMANIIGGDARVIEKVTSGIFGTTALHTLDAITSGVQFVATGGADGSLTTAIEKSLEDISKPYALNGYGGLENRFMQEIYALQDRKNEIEHGDPNKNSYIKYNEEISKETDPKKRQELIKKRNGLLSEFQKKIENLVKGYRNKGGSLDRYEFSLVTGLLTFEDALRADRNFMHLNTDYYDARDQAMATLYEYGVTNPDAPSSLGYIYIDKNGHEQLKMWTPAQMQIINSAYYEQGDIHAAKIEAIINDGTENSLKNLGQQEYEAEQKYWNKKKMSSSDYDAIDELRKAYDAKVVLALNDYMNAYGAYNVLSKDAVMDYLEDIIKVPTAYEKVKGRIVSSGGGKLNKQQGFAESYIKLIFGVK